MKSIYTILVLTVCSFQLTAQQQAPNFTLYSQLSGIQKYEATEYIDMVEGFEYKANNQSDIFHAKINPFLVFPPVGGEIGGPGGLVGSDGVVGATKGSLSVNDAGSAVYQMPLEFPGGISGMTPELSLVYNSSGSDGILGPGWSLGGLSVISCVPATRYHNGIRQAAFGNDFEDGAYTLDGQRLVPVLYDDEAHDFREYRTEMNVFSKIIRLSTAVPGKDPAGSYFRVMTKSGLNYTYGRTLDSRHSFIHNETSASYTISYYVNSIDDNMGNKITFEYNNNQANGEITIKSIKYTYTDGSTGSVPIYSIDFFYKERPDLITYYLAYKTNTGDISVKTSTSKVIDSISCTHISTNTIVKEYILDYILRGPGNDDTKKTLHLNALQEYGKNRSEKYNKTVFEWEAEPQEYSFSETEKILPETFYYSWTVYGNHQGDIVKNVKYLFLDVNLDGKTDILRTYQLQRKNLINGDVVFTHFYVLEYLKKSSDGNYIMSEVYKHEDTPFSWTFETYIVPGDFNGDAFIDLLICSADESKSFFNLIRNNGNNFGNNNILDTETLTGFNSNYHPFIGDYNGDGISDVWFVPLTGTGNQIWRLGNKDVPLEGNIDVSGDKTLTYDPQQITLSENSPLYIEDFNGDGRTDIKFGEEKVYFLKPESGQNTIEATSKNVSFNNMKEAIINEDNKQDFIRMYIDNNSIYWDGNSLSFDIKTKLFLGDGNAINSDVYVENSYSIGGLYIEPIYPYEWIEPYSSVYIKHTSDFNGDGRSDYICNVIYGLSSYISTGQYGEPALVGETRDEASYILLSFNSKNYTITQALNWLVYPLELAHVNNDNQTDICRFLKSSTYTYDDRTDKLIVNSLAQQGSRISSITNGLGHKTIIEYAFTGDPEVYTPGAEVEYPVVPYEVPRCVVKKVNRSNGQGGFFTDQYKYEKARAHMEGLGFIGFEKITKIDVTRDIESITEYGLDTEFCVSYPLKQTTKLVNGPIIEQTINKFVVESETSGIQNYSGNKKYYFVRPEESEIFNYELNEYQTSSSVYKRTQTLYAAFDLYGNPGTITTTYQDMTYQNALVFKKITGHTYAPADVRNEFDGNKFYWVLGRLTESSTIFEAPEETSITKKSGFTYYQATDGKKYGMLKEEKDYKFNNPDAVLTTKTYTYDAFGNILNTQTSATGLSTISNTTNYTEDGRFIDELINPLGHKTIREYNEQLATLLFERFETDPNNILITELQYDGFGRLEKGIAPDGMISASALRWVLPGDPHTPDPVHAIYYTWQQTSGKPEVKVYYNSLGMELRSVTNGFKNILVYVDSYYNEKGQLWKKSAPYNPNTETPKYAENTYDRFLRVKTTTVPDEGGNAVTLNTYNGFTVSTKNALNQENSKTLNAAGWTVKSTDATGNSVLHTYYADGAISSTEVEGYDNTTRTYKYDDSGNLSEYKDASQGILNYIYNAYGQLISETNAKGQTTLYTEYDLLGRLREKETFDGDFTYHYDQQKNGLLDYINGPGNRVSYTYDDLLRPLTQTETIDIETFVTTYDYDELGRLQHLTYPSDYKIRNTYTDNGYPLAIIDTEDGKKLWEAKFMNARGQFTNVNVGDIAQTFEYYENSGRIWKIKAFGLQNNTYIWDKGGNLKNRSSRIGKSEGFIYDYLNRLKEVYHNDQLSFSYRYDALGNITHKSDVGDYAYDNSNNPYELSTINNKPATINNDNQVIYYNSFNKVYKITETDPVTLEIKRQLDLIYGVDNSRVKQIITENGTITSSKLYIGGSYEVETKNGVTSLIHYINAPTGLVAMVIKKGNDKETEFVLNDHLGSLQVLATRSGILIEEFSYDAWGMRRDPATFVVFAVVPPGGTAYGFTGHEHIDLFMLVNMDGRMYDPVLGRFLSPDPVLQFPNYTQGQNPYAYALNNPLRFVDPNGYSLIGQLLGLTASVALSFVPGINFLVPVLVYSVVMTIDYAIELGRAANLGNLYGYFVQTFVMSTISAGVTKGIGDYFGKTGKFALEFKRAIAHGTFNGAMRWAQGGKFEHGFLSGFVSSLGGSFMQAYGADMSGAGKIAISAAIGGTAEALGGGKFANGAVTGAYVMALNHMEHEILAKQREQARTKIIADIANFTGLSTTVIENAMKFAYVTTDQLRDELLAAGHSTKQVDEVISRSATTGGIARIGSRLLFYGQVGYSIYNIWTNPTGSNIALQGADILFGGLATYGGLPGVGIAAAYWLGKESIIMAQKSLQQGIVKPNPNMTWNYVGGLMPVPLITK
jgi:RHS repeat-associated protein